MRATGDSKEDLTDFEDRSSWAERHRGPMSASQYAVTARVPVVEMGHLDRKKAKIDFIIASQVVLAIVLLLLVVIFVPRPNIRLTNTRFETSVCNQATSTFVVTAYVSLMNGGGADGDIFVRFYVDGQRKGTEEIFVPAHATIDRSMSVALMDCSAHHYTVDTCVPTASHLTTC
jgi:hypothetical protein